MKICSNCGRENRDESAFCGGCGSSSFNAPVQMYQPPEPEKTKPPFGVCDLLTILGFVSSIVGLFFVWIVFEPVALISSLIGFIKGTRSKALAAAGIVIAVVAFIIQLFYTLYKNGVVEAWVYNGIFK